MRLIVGDCVEAMRLLDEGSVDAVVTDPPYALPGGFMGRTWDNFDGRLDAGACYHLAGLIDGEGCFRVQRHPRGTHTCTFSMQMRSDDGAILKRAQRLVGVGTVAKHEHNGGNPMMRWTVQDKDGCEVLVGFLRRYPLRAKKAVDFEAWAEAVGEWVGRPRGNRWHGMADQTRAAQLKDRIERAREFRDVPWSGHRFQDWTREWAEEAFRVLKPGGHLLAFGGSRTYHRLASAVEDAGFEVRDQMMWLYGSGFPKSHNLDGDWQGWGTALKPAHEPIVVARKPLVGTVAANVLAFGTGALNVDGCRIETDGERFGGGANATSGFVKGYERGDGFQESQTGRWPANVVLDPVAAAMLDEQAPDTGGGGFCGGGIGDGLIYGAPGSGQTRRTGRVDANGGASRFFYCAKASSRERNAGLNGFDRISGGALNMRNDAHAHSTGNASSPRANVHPTVKPIDLMRYLVRLVTPPGGTVLDPFTGSGTTGIAAALEGMDFIGCEREQEYADIARARIEWWERHAGEGDTDEILAAAERREQREQTGQLELGEAA